MDRSLAERLNALWAQRDRVKKAEEQYLELEANRKPLLAQLTLKAEGKSFAEREARALASEDWANFIAGHVKAETEFNHEMRTFGILDKAFFAEHATYKIDDRSIKKASG